MGLHEFQLTAPIGFTFDTSLADARCIYDGFFDRYPNLKLIASHLTPALKSTRLEIARTGLSTTESIGGTAVRSTNGLSSSMRSSLRPTIRRSSASR